MEVYTCLKKNQKISLNFLLKREINYKTIKVNQVIDYIISLKNNLKIDDIREELKNPKYSILKSESKDIKRNLYNIEK